MPRNVVPVSPPCEPPPGVGTALDLTPVIRSEQVVFANLCNLPAAPRNVARPALHFSLVAQLDGILYKELKVCLEVDVLASSAGEAVSQHWGAPTHGVPLGAVEGLYWGPTVSMPAVVAAVASQHGRGLFIVSPPGRLSRHRERLRDQLRHSEGAAHPLV